ncbi:methionyl-tRNA formyltransferase [Vibrio jasicida]|uniref:methionyl-tRNA formyltransferase n=1 Tax=Vibrio jasicida TaxID=766224 RepID=UPI000CE43334|nr:formyltransferase family protein [Vibrio jasicida]
MTERYVVFSGSCYCLSLVDFLYQHNKLAAVVLPTQEVAENSDLAQLRKTLSQHQIPTIQYDNTNVSKCVSQLDELRVTSGLIYLFRHLIPQPLLSYFSHELLNIHPGHLPTYRGSMPIFWQIAKGEKSAMLSLHRASENEDCGEIALQLEVPIHPFDTSQCLFLKMSQALPMLFERYQQLKMSGELHFAPQTGTGVTSKVQEHDLFIDWQKMSSTEIVNLSRASNPEFGGSRVLIRGEAINLLQATATATRVKGIATGTILASSQNNGLIIKTIDTAICLDILATQQGVFDGYRFATLFGLDAGMNLNQLM